MGVIVQKIWICVCNLTYLKEDPVTILLSKHKIQHSSSLFMFNTTLKISSFSTTILLANCAHGILVRNKTVGQTPQ